MDFSFLVQDLISAVVIGLIGAFWKKLRNGFADNGKHMTPNTKMPKKTLYRYFLCCLFGLLLSIVFFCSIDAPSPVSVLSILKIFSGFGVFFGVILTWGAFDAAFAFYPTDNNMAESLPDSQTERNHKDP